MDGCANRTLSSNLSKAHVGIVHSGYVLPKFYPCATWQYLSWRCPTANITLLSNLSKAHGHVLPKFYPCATWQSSSKEELALLQMYSEMNQNCLLQLPQISWQPVTVVKHLSLNKQIILAKKTFMSSTILGLNDEKIQWFKFFLKSILSGRQIWCSAPIPCW